MALMAEPREPEVARFIDSYKYDQEMSSRRNRFGGGTSLPLDSDGYEDKQRQLREERHKDWLQQQDKQRQMEQQKMEARRHQSPPRPAQPPGLQVDYNAQNDHARAEERRAYQDYMKAKEERYWAMRGRPVTPPGGLNIGNYDRQIKETAAQRKKEYKEMLDQQKNEQLKLRAMDRVAEVSPKYVKYRDEERPLVGSPRDINYYRQEQQKEHMYLRARQEPEISVIDRNAQNTNPNYLANKPPPGPGYSRVRDEPKYQTPTYWNEGREAGGPGSYDSGVRSNQSSGIPVTEERRRQDEIKHQQQQSSKPSEIVRNPFYSSDDYEKFQREIQRKQAEDYRDFLAKKNTEVRKRDWNYEQNGVLELRGDDAVQSKQRELRAERQRDYNNYMSQVKPSSNRVWPEPDGKGALLVKKGEYENVRRMFDEERKQDYLNALQKRREQRVSNPSRRHEFVDTASGPYGGLFHGLGEHGNRSEVLNRERQQEYNNMLDQQYGKDRPSGRPNWAKETIPNDRDRGRSPMKNPAAADQYQQMLDEKRREEASRRRYEDPEYQSRLSQGRDRGEAGARYGY